MNPRKGIRLSFEQLEVRTTPSLNFGHAFGFGTSSVDIGQHIAADSTGTVVVAGSFFTDSIDLDLGPGTLTLLGSGGYLVKIDPSGSVTWARGNVPGNSAMVIDAAANIYLTGSSADMIDADPGPRTYNLTSAGSNDIIVSQLDAEGNYVWAGSMGETASDIARAIALDGSGNIHTTGTFQAAFDLDPGVDLYNLTSTQNSNGNTISDIFVSNLVATPTAPETRFGDVTLAESNTAQQSLS